MTGPEHYQEAERLLAAGELPESERDYTAPSLEVLLAGVGHAVLALAAATALQHPGGDDAGMTAVDMAAWEDAASAYVPREQP